MPSTNFLKRCITKVYCQFERIHFHTGKPNVALFLIFSDVHLPPRSKYTLCCSGKGYLPVLGSDLDGGGYPHPICPSILGSDLDGGTPLPLPTPPPILGYDLDGGTLPLSWDLTWMGGGYPNPAPPSWDLTWTGGGREEGSTCPALPHPHPYPGIWPGWGGGRGGSTPPHPAPPPRDLTWSGPSVGYPTTCQLNGLPPRCEQTENITFPHSSDAGGNEWVKYWPRK